MEVPPPAMASIVNYANFHQVTETKTNFPPCKLADRKVQILISYLDQGCAEDALTLFMQYLPFVFLLQAVSIINIIITIVILIIFDFLL